MLYLNPIPEKFVENYLNYFYGRSFFLLEKKLKKENFPIVSRIVGYFLAQILLEKNPKKVLELGTGPGLSTLYMALVIKKFNLNTKIITLDIRPDFLEIAKNNFKKFKVEDVVSIYNLSSQEFLENTSEQFDFIFFDHEKRQYKKDLYLILKRNLIKTQGVILIDNLFARGEIFLPNSKKERKYILLDFINFLFSEEVLKRAFVNILPVSDGLAFLKFFK